MAYEQDFGGKYKRDERDVSAREMVLRGAALWCEATYIVYRISYNVKRNIPRVEKYPDKFSVWVLFYGGLLWKGELYETKNRTTILYRITGCCQVAAEEIFIAVSA